MLSQEQYVNEICEKVFQKFPDFTEKCKQAAFEAMSDPMYSGKMKVGWSRGQKSCHVNGKGS